MTQNRILKADRGTCQGYGNCVIKAPKYFDLDDDGLVFIPREGVDPTDLEQSTTIAPEDLNDVKEAVNSCPVAALWIEDEA